MISFLRHIFHGQLYGAIMQKIMQNYFLIGQDILLYSL